MVGVSHFFAVLATFRCLSILQISQVQFWDTLFAGILLILVVVRRNFTGRTSFTTLLSFKNDRLSGEDKRRFFLDACMLYYGDLGFLVASNVTLAPS